LGRVDAPHGFIGLCGLYGVMGPCGFKGSVARLDYASTGLLIGPVFSVATLRGIGKPTPTL
jgi:hypothetical protein